MHKYLSKEGDRVFLVVLSERTRGNKPKLKYSQFCLEIRKKISPIYCKGYQTLEDYGKRAGVFSICGDIQNLSGHILGNLLQLIFYFFNGKNKTSVGKSELTETPHA